MPDSVICTQTAPHTFSCDVELSPEASSAATLAAPQPSAKAITQTPNPAVATLVTSYQRVELPTPEKPYLPASTLLKCASSDAAVIAALAAQSAGTLALLGAFKAGFDMGKCIAQEHNAAVSEAGAQESAADCAAAGGTVTGTNGNTTFCEVDRSAR
ncbi:MAG TPA: hypothetical protein VHV51_04265 [Polyangiaceae bacterium]|nr:hypothetical protein [Polyangiaceae bacterium]